MLRALSSSDAPQLLYLELVYSHPSCHSPEKKTIMEFSISSFDIIVYYKSTTWHVKLETCFT